jgi:uncharacterized SAM-binding protein YcdF (DUF218 family)
VATQPQNLAHIEIAGVHERGLTFTNVFYLEPALPALLLFGLIGALRAWKTSPKGKRPVLYTIAIGGILLLSTNVFAWILSLPLECWYDHNSAAPSQRPEAIVVLAGSTHSPSPNQPYVYPAEDTYQRLQHALWLFKHWGSSLPILVCGGTGDDDEPYSHTMGKVLESAGVPSNLIWIEDQSKNTHENAMFGSEILRSHGVSLVALVVEANSMWRAASSFQKNGINVLPAPIRFTQLNFKLTDIFPSWQPIALNGEHIHELVGLLWYRSRGWI